MSVLYVVELDWAIAARPNDVFEYRMDLTALYKEQIYKKKNRKRKKKGRGKKKQCHFPTAKSLPFALIALFLLVSFSP